MTSAEQLRRIRARQQIAGAIYRVIAARYRSALVELFAHNFALARVAPGDGSETMFDVDHSLFDTQLIAAEATIRAQKIIDATKTD